MQVTIEIDGETFQGASVKEVKAAARKAKVLARKREQAERAAWELAKVRAESAGYRVLSRLALGNIPRGWSIMQSRNSGYGPRLRYENCSYVSMFYTAHGYGRWAWLTTRIEILGTLQDSGGCDLAVFTETWDGVEAFAIGVAETDGTEGAKTQTYLTDLPGVTLEQIEALRARNQEAK